ncbi:MAG TPA: hypothetical protein VHU84_04195 [Lacipirellulaceae bacterium]|nr:hypothetical protein [Lacipirellulaceae bacterium]
MATKILVSASVLDFGEEQLLRSGIEVREGLFQVGSILCRDSLVGRLDASSAFHEAARIVGHPAGVRVISKQIAAHRTAPASGWLAAIRLGLCT